MINNKNQKATSMPVTSQRFLLGMQTKTATIAEYMNQSLDFGQWVMFQLMRHINNDWGEVCEEDWILNDDAIREGLRIFSSYDIPPHVKKSAKTTDDKVWIITEANRSSTCILFPSDY